jgi:hypothetical protein
MQAKQAAASFSLLVQHTIQYISTSKYFSVCLEDAMEMAVHHYGFFVDPRDANDNNN